MKYDLHIHSCLSPCSEDEMSINNMINMALIKELDLISVTDHNCMKNQKVIAKVAREKGLRYLYGVEVQTSEDVHVLCYFKKEEYVDKMQTYLDTHLPKIKNNTQFFGHQYCMNEYDEVIEEYPWLLLNSLDVSLSELVHFVHQNEGHVVLAHIYKLSNGIIHHLGFIPKELAFDGVELKSKDEEKQLYQSHPWMSNIEVYYNSDAHQLIDIQEAIHTLEKGGWFYE
ncbi:MAG: PHP domain-containing protein [Erysipelotrichaceae bacterium]